ncbi:SSI family serine proteinase inhibitor [Streptomyces cinnamoneus]
MKKLQHWQVAGAVIAATLLISGLSTATAHASSAQAPSAQLGIAVFHGDDIRQYHLTCAPDGGEHPDPRTACNQLRKADGSLLTLRPGTHPSCNEPETDPVDVEIMGTWNGQITVFNERYPNLACAQASAGRVVPFH